MENKVCVYAIAKNEAKNVAKWVASMQSADHVIVLDTGSEDDTVELLSALGVEVHQKIYDHFRFDVARNDAMALVPEEYNILVSTDIDEVWEQPNWVEIVKENWDKEAPRLMYNYVWNHSDDGEPQLQFHINKIHGRENIAWGGAVHEYLYDTVTGKKGGFKFVDVTKILTLHHWHDIQKDRSFYLDLIEERTVENPEDGQTWFLAGNENLVKGNPEKALYFYNYYVENFQEGSPEYNQWELSSVYYHLGKTYYLLHNAPKAWEAYNKGIVVNKMYRDNYFGLAIICLDNKMPDMAIGVLKEGLQTSKPIHGWMDDPNTWTFALYDLLGLGYSMKNDYVKALGYAAKALSYDPTNPILVQRYDTYLQNL